MTTDADLARAAQAGDVAALGLLLERHQAALRAHALRLLGHRADAHDAVQDTFVVALRKLGQLRDPAAVEGWLHTALRSLCLSRLRRDHGELALHELDPPAGPAGSPEAAVDALALRDWVWTAIGRLSEPLRIVAMLRYFGAYSSYEEIASICGVPVGTVRSRLSQVKAKLADALLETAQAAHGEAAARQAAQLRHFDEAVAGFARTGSHDAFLAPFPDDVEVAISGGPVFRGRAWLAGCLEQDAIDGVGFVPTAVICGPGITILEARFVNPPDDPDHCPPGIAQVHLHRGDETPRMVWHRAARAQPSTSRGLTP